MPSAGLHLELLGESGAAFSLCPWHWAAFSLCPWHWAPPAALGSRRDKEPSPSSALCQEPSAIHRGGFFFLLESTWDRFYGFFQQALCSSRPSLVCKFRWHLTWLNLFPCTSPGQLLLSLRGILLSSQLCIAIPEIWGVPHHLCPHLQDSGL